MASNLMKGRRVVEGERWENIKSEAPAINEVFYCFVFSRSPHPKLYCHEFPFEPRFIRFM